MSSTKTTKLIAACAAAFMLIACGQKEEDNSAELTGLNDNTVQPKHYEPVALAPAEGRAVQEQKLAAKREADEKQRAELAARQEKEDQEAEARQKAEDARLRPLAIEKLKQENAKLRAEKAAELKDPDSLDGYGRVYFDKKTNLGTINTSPNTIELYDITKPRWTTTENTKGVAVIDTVEDEAVHDHDIGTVYNPGDAYNVNLNFNRVCVADDQGNSTDDCKTLSEVAGGALDADIKLLQQALRNKQATMSGPKP